MILSIFSCAYWSLVCGKMSIQIPCSLKYVLSFYHRIVRALYIDVFCIQISYQIFDLHVFFQKITYCMNPWNHGLYGMSRVGKSIEIENRLVVS